MLAHLQKTCKISGLLTDSAVDIKLLSVRSTWIETRYNGRHKCFENGKSQFQIPSWNSILLNLIASSSVCTSYYVTTTSFLTLLIHYELIIAESSVECCERKQCPGVVFMGKLAVTLKLYRAATSLSYADSYFFPKQKNSCSQILLTHCGRVTQICIFNMAKLGASASSP